VRGQDFYRPWAGCAQGYELCCVLLFYYPLWDFCFSSWKNFSND
jgi:hypothetical protein